MNDREPKFSIIYLDHYRDRFSTYQNGKGDHDNDLNKRYKTLVLIAYDHRVNDERNALMLNAIPPPFPPLQISLL